MCTRSYPLLQDSIVVESLLMTELREAAKSFIQSGVPLQLICQVFEKICDKVLTKIDRISVSMKYFDMKDELYKFYATQIPKQLFESSREHMEMVAVDAVYASRYDYKSYREHMAKVVVDAVHASGYDYDGAGPYLNNVDDFEDGFNLIGIKKVLGGGVTDSFSSEGVCMVFKPHVDGFENLDVVENPEILILNINPAQKSQNEDMSAEVNLIEMLRNPVKKGPNVVLTSQAIDGDSKKELAKRCIYYVDLVSEDDLDRVAEATYAETISYDHDYQPRIRIGTCNSFQQKIRGGEVFGTFSGCPKGKAVTIVLRGDDQFIEEAEMYVDDLIPEVRSVMHAYKLVEGGLNLYHNIIQYVREEANKADEDSKPIINAFADAIQAVSDKIYGGNAGCNPSLKPAGVPNSVWEPPSLKFYAIHGATGRVCFQLKRSLIR